MKKKIVFLPYDFDTALGINNEGSLTFDYGLEDVDQVNGADVFNGQQSVLWNNLRDAFPDEIKEMYAKLRSDGIISFDVVEGMFEEHQHKWPETVFNEDAMYKYIDPLVNDGNDSYLEMLLGSKEIQRVWWLYNRFRYMDSKWNAGDAYNDMMIIRGYAKSDITITPYADIYPSVQYGSYLVQKRGKRGQAYTLPCPLDNLDDTEIHIFSAGQIADIGDVSGLMPGFCDFSKAVRLQKLKIGSNASGYSNQKMTSLSVGNLPLLRSIDVRNCPNLKQTVDLSGCANLREAYFSGTAVTGVQLANGGAVETLVLPNTITNLTLRNLQKLSSLTVAGYSNVTTLWLEGNSSAVNSLNIFNSIATGARVRILDVDWSISNWSTFFTRLKSMRGMDERDNNMDLPQISGTIYTSTISSGDLAYMKENFPNVTMLYTTIQSTVYYYDETGSTLYQTKSVSSGGSAPSYSPTKAQTAQYTYSFAGWSRTPGGSVDSTALSNVTSDRNLYAVFNATLRKYTVRFYNETTLLQTVSNVNYGGTATYTGSEPAKEGYEFSGWSPSPTNITGDTSCYAQFSLATLEVVEIADSWAEIIAACNDGTYKTKYNVGNYKPLTIGSETINMQIAGMDKDDLADGSGKAPVTWIAKELLATSKAWNPALVTNYKYDPGPSFVRNTTTTSNTGYNQWNPKNAYQDGNIAKISFKVTAVTDGTLRLTYVTGTATADDTSLKVDGNEVVTTRSTSAQSYDLPITSGTTYDIVFENKKLNATGSTSTYIKLCNTSGSGTKANVDALVTQDEVVIEDCAIRAIDNYETGTGAIGGWESSAMREYLRTTIFESLPTEIQSAIKPVTKNQCSYNTAGSAVAQTTTETVWLPSYHEVGLGNLTGETSAMMKYNVLFRDNASRIKYKVGASSATYWWLRSAYTNSTVYYVYSNGSKVQRRCLQYLCRVPELLHLIFNLNNLPGLVPGKEIGI